MFIVYEYLLLKTAHWTTTATTTTVSCVNLIIFLLQKIKTILNFSAHFLSKEKIVLLWVGFSQGLSQDFFQAEGG